MFDLQIAVNGEFASTLLILWLAGATSEKRPEVRLGWQGRRQISPCSELDPAAAPRISCLRSGVESVSPLVKATAGAGLVNHPC